jgi:hypothetical protein
MTLDTQLEKGRTPRKEAGDESYGAHTQLIANDFEDLDIKTSTRPGVNINWEKVPQSSDKLSPSSDFTV